MKKAISIMICIILLTFTFSTVTATSRSSGGGVSVILPVQGDGEATPTPAPTGSPPPTPALTPMPDWDSWPVFTYDANGGSGGKVVSDHLHNGHPKHIVLTPEAANVSRPGYTFISWNTKADGSGEDYSPGEGIGSATGFTLYATWEPDYDFEIDISDHALDPTGEKWDVSIAISNPKLQSASPILFIGYFVNNRLICIAADEINLNGEPSTTIEMSMEVPLTPVTTYHELHLRAFLWNSAYDLTPLALPCIVDLRNNTQPND